MNRIWLALAALLSFSALTIRAAVAAPYFQRDFTAQDFAERRAHVFDAIGNKAIAVIQGRPDTGDMSSFRQSNEFYYLTGIEVPHAYLLLDGKTRRTTIYLPHRDAPREATEGQSLAAEDAELVAHLTGADAVRGTEFLAQDLAGSGLIRPPAPLLYTPLSPAETISRDELLAAEASIYFGPVGGQRASRRALQATPQCALPPIRGARLVAHSRCPAADQIGQGNCVDSDGHHNFRLRHH